MDKHEELIEKSIKSGEELAEEFRININKYLKNAPDNIDPIIAVDSALLQTHMENAIWILKNLGKNFAIRTLTANFKATLELLLEEEEEEEETADTKPK